MDDSQQKATILAVDDSRVMLVAAAKALKAEFEVLKANDGAEAWEIIQQHPEISVIFSDLSMPNMNGYELLAAVRGSDNPQIAKIPIVVLTGQEDGDGTKERVMESGATDFLTKPFESLDLLSRARSLSSLSKQVNELEKKVSLDKLTRLYTEASFKDSGERAAAYAIRHGTPISLLRIDIDQFQQIFVKHGKEKAEEILTRVADIIKTLLRQEDVAARLGVFKFALLLIETDDEGVQQVLTRLRLAIEATDFGIGEKVSISAGSDTPHIAEGLQFDSICASAEAALQQAVAQGTSQAVHNKPSAQQTADTQKRGPRIDLNAVLREVEKNGGERLGAPQLNAALNTLLPVLKCLDQKMSLGLEQVMRQLENKVEK